MNTHDDLRYQRPGWVTRHVIDPAIRGLTRIGVSVWGSRILEVRGRQSGQARRTPVNLLDLDGRHYLVSPPGGDPMGPQPPFRRRPSGPDPRSSPRRTDRHRARRRREGTGPPGLSPEVEDGSRRLLRRRHRRLRRRHPVGHRLSSPRLSPRRDRDADRVRR